VTALRRAELELRETAARFIRIVVHHGRFEPFAEWGRLRELAPQPAQQPDRIGAGGRHSFFT
jgi:hypothetical protein